MIGQIAAITPVYIMGCYPILIHSWSTQALPPYR